MTTRERAIEAMARGMAEAPSNGVSLRGLFDVAAKSIGVEWNEAGFQRDMLVAATAALDAALEVLGEPGEEMVRAGRPWAGVSAGSAKKTFAAMLATLRKEG